MFRGIRNAFLAGALLLAPLAATIFVADLLLDNIGAPAASLLFQSMSDELKEYEWISMLTKVISTLVVVVCITVLGYLSRFFIGKIILSFAERVIGRLPFISTVYNTVKQIVDTFSQQQRAVFQKTVMIEYPRKGIYAIGFLTGEAKGEIQERTGKVMGNVFIPTTPNPTSGFLLILPMDDIIQMDMTVGEGMKLIISGGAVVPPSKLEKAKLEESKEQEDDNEK